VDKHVVGYFAFISGPQVKLRASTVTHAMVVKLHNARCAIALLYAMETPLRLRSFVPEDLDPMIAEVETNLQFGRGDLRLCGYLLSLLSRYRELLSMGLQTYMLEDLLDNAIPDVEFYAVLVA
jgi:hypothetical protein